MTSPGILHLAPTQKYPGKNKENITRNFDIFSDPFIVQFGLLYFPCGLLLAGELSGQGFLFRPRGFRASVSAGRRPVSGRVEEVDGVDGGGLVGPPQQRQMRRHLRCQAPPVHEGAVGERPPLERGWVGG